MVQLGVSLRVARGFSVQRFIALLAVALALILISFLLWKTLRNPIETRLACYPA